MFCCQTLVWDKQQKQYDMQYTNLVLSINLDLQTYNLYKNKQQYLSEPNDLWNSEELSKWLMHKKNKE